MSKKNRNKQYNLPVTGTASHYVKHTHMGRKLLWTLPLGGGVYAGARSDLAGRYAAILDCTGIATYVSTKTAVSVNGPDEERYAKLLSMTVAPATRILIDWPDGGVPPVVPEFWRTLVETVKGNLAVCCVGGHGRTGTALVAMFMAQHADTGKGPQTLADVATFIRVAHCEEAIETEEQCDYLAALAYTLGYEEGERLESSNSYRFANLAAQKDVTPKMVGVPTKDDDAKYKWTHTYEE